MKVIDHNGRLFGKISVIDVLVILVVIALAGALYVKNTRPHTGTSVTTQTITYQVLVEGAQSYLKDNIHVGDKVYDLTYSSGGSPLGEITAIEEQPGSKLTTFTDGTMGLASVEDGVNLLLTIEGEGLVNDKGYSINRVYDLGINAARTYYTKYVEFNITVTKIF